jgi:1-pyrroline-5-carboxylate dehydrogenase
MKEKAGGRSVTFKNENTFYQAKEKGEEEIVHSKYERAVRDLEQHLGETMLNYIGGQPTASKGGLFEDRFPGDISILSARFQESVEEDARLAIKAAESAFEGWRSTDYQSRCDIFEKAASLLSERKHEMAAMITLENGKNRYEGMADVDEAIDFLRYYSLQMRENRGYMTDMPPPYPDERPRDLLKPYGVWGVISPFNFPCAIMAGMSTAAMLAGNTVVVKPSSDAPWPALALAEMLEEAGLPPGIFNVVTGAGGRIGRELVEDPAISGLVFTGSREVGIGAMKAFLEDKPRPFIAEMGGKNAVIVTEEADLDEAVEGVGRAAFGYGGQKCSACSRAIVQKGIASEFVRLLKDWTMRLVVGDPREKSTFLGPLINEAALERYKRSVKSARASGRIETGGKLLTSLELNGYYVEPTVVTGLKADHELVKSELFLPFLCVLEVSSLEKAVEMANSSDYGLTSGIMSRSQAEVDYFMDNIEAGTVYANRRSGASTAAMVGSQPFVGWKMSGSTGKAAGGRYYLPQFMREQSQTQCL